MKVKLKLYAQERRVMNQVHERLRGALKKFSFTRLPLRRFEMALRPSVSGRGYANFYKYYKRVHRALVVLHDIKDLNTVMKKLHLRGLLIQTSVC